MSYYYYQSSYGVIPDQTWGSLPLDLQQQWKALSCDDILQRASSSPPSEPQHQPSGPSSIKDSGTSSSSGSNKSKKNKEEAKGSDPLWWTGREYTEPLDADAKEEESARLQCSDMKVRPHQASLVTYQPCI